MLFKEAEAELGGADSCSQPVTFYIGRARKFFAADFVKWNMMIMMIVAIVMIMINKTDISQNKTTVWSWYSSFIKNPK